MKYEITSEPLPRAFIIGLIRNHLTDGQAFPSAVMSWLAEALTQAGSRCSDLRHADLLQSAAYHMHQLAIRQRERDDAHYSDVAPHASADNVVTGE